MTSEVLVTIAQGTLRGKRNTSDVTGEDYYSFQAIPYTKPPVGPLRFKPPQPPESWEGVRDATKEGAICPQYYHYHQEYRGEEDSLFINVYVKQWPPTDLKPVMVWFHGGGFYRGSGNTDVYGPDYLVKENVILVTFNYRINVLGFLYVEGTDVTPNNGLRDQVAALKWINKNIVEFGGDSNNVTIFGYSSGGSAVHYMMLAPSAKATPSLVFTLGLFHRAIAQSGSALYHAYNVRPKDASARAFRLGKSLGIHTSDPKVLVESLRNISPRDLVMNQDKALTEEEKLHAGTRTFTVIEEQPISDSCIPGKPEILLKGGKFHKCPLISGTTSAEGKLGLTDSLNNMPLEEVDQNFQRTLTWNLKQIISEDKFFEISNRLRKFYFNDKPVCNDTVEKYIDLRGDLHFNYPAHVIVRNYLKHSNMPIYCYNFTKKEALVLPGCNAELPKLPGANHGSDVTYLFHMGLKPVKFIPGSNEDVTSKNIIKLWTNFAKSGNPDDGMDFKWNTVKNGKRPYLDISEKLVLREGLCKDRMEFLDEVFG